MKHLLKLLDHSSDTIYSTLALADELKAKQKKGEEHKYLAGKTLGLIFSKSSTRPRVSFEVGMAQLGGPSLFLSANVPQMGLVVSLCRPPPAPFPDTPTALFSAPSR